MYKYPHANEIYKVTILRNFEKPKVTAPIYQHLWAHKFVSHNTKFVKNINKSNVMKWYHDHKTSHIAHIIENQLKRDSVSGDRQTYGTHTHITNGQNKKASKKMKIKHGERKT